MKDCFDAKPDERVSIFMDEYNIKLYDCLLEHMEIVSKWVCHLQS